VPEKQAPCGDHRMLTCGHGFRVRSGRQRHLAVLV
jgi:hypothetical protein